MNLGLPNKPDGPNRRQPLGLRAAVGEAGVRGLSAAVGHPGRSAYMTRLLTITVLLFWLAPAPGANETESETAQWEAASRRLAERLGVTNQTELTNLIWTNLVRGYIVHPSFGLAWDEVPPPTLTNAGAMRAVEAFIETNGWNMHTNRLVFSYGDEQTRPIRGLPWGVIKDREFPALTHRGVLYVVLRGWHHNLSGVAYNPNTNAFADAIAGFKPLAGHWYVWAQPDNPIKLPQVYEGQKSAEPSGAANGSQPIRSETNRTSSAAGSRR